MRSFLNREFTVMDKILTKQKKNCTVKKHKDSFRAENSITAAVTVIHRYIAHNCIGSSIKHDNTRLAIIVNDRYSNKMPLQNWPFGHGYLSRHSPI